MFYGYVSHLTLAPCCKSATGAPSPSLNVCGCPPLASYGRAMLPSPCTRIQQRTENPLLIFSLTRKMFRKTRDLGTLIDFLTLVKSIKKIACMFQLSKDKSVYSSRQVRTCYSCILCIIQLPSEREKRSVVKFYSLQVLELASVAWTRVPGQCWTPPVR